MPFKLGGIFYSTFGNVITPFFGSSGVKANEKVSADNLKKCLETAANKVRLQVCVQITPRLWK